jgi:hypothetical protein
MKKVIASLVAVAGMSVAANAQVNTNVAWQVSANGIDGWTAGTLNVNPGSTVYARALVSYSGTAAPLGLASLVFQPTVSNWSAADTLGAFVNGGQGGNTSTPVGVVTDPNSTTSFGRLSPWGRTALSVTSFLRGHVHTAGSGQAPAGTWLRIAQNQITSWIDGTGNTTGGNGVPISQLNDVGRTAADPAFNGSLQNIVVFKMALTLSGVASRPDLVVDSPAGGFGNRNATTGAREVYWFASMSETTGSIRGTANVTTATIHVVPAPASMALLGLGGLAVARRRR